MDDDGVLVRRPSLDGFSYVRSGSPQALPDSHHLKSAIDEEGEVLLLSKDELKREYDFSKATRGKSFRPALRLRLPVYLDEEALAVVQCMAREKKIDVSSVVNPLMISNMHLAEVIG